LVLADRVPPAILRVQPPALTNLAIRALPVVSAESLNRRRSWPTRRRNDSLFCGVVFLAPTPGGPFLEAQNFTVANPLQAPPLIARVP
jgi:hypothetical protein